MAAAVRLPPISHEYSRALLIHVFLSGDGYWWRWLATTTTRNNLMSRARLANLRGQTQRISLQRSRHSLNGEGRSSPKKKEEVKRESSGAPFLPHFLRHPCGLSKHREPCHVLPDYLRHAPRA